MAVKIGDAVKLHAGEGKEPIDAIVNDFYHSGAIDAKLADGAITYVLPGNFDVVGEETKAVPAAAEKTAHAPVVTKHGQFTTITR